MAFLNQQKVLNELKKNHHHRHLAPMESAQGRLLKYQGRKYLNFSSNNYLALAEDKRLQTAVQTGLETWGVGAGASRLVNGSFEPWHQVEEALAKFKGMEAALIFNSGYQANVGALSCLLGEGDGVFSDELNHASMIDGIRLSRAQRFIYRHLDLADLAEQLKKFRSHSPQAQIIIATEAVFSMDGDLCPLKEILDLAEEWDALVYLDEAHATGVMGESGAGLSESVRAHPAYQTRLILMGTLGKALGSFGAYVASAQALCDYLINKARAFIYTTALPPALAFSVLAALKIIQEEPERRRQLQERILQARESLSPWLPKNILKSSQDFLSPILPLVIGEAEATLKLAEHLKQAGLWVQAIRPPTVPQNSSRLRVTLMSSHLAEDVERLAQALTQARL